MDDGAVADAGAVDVLQTPGLGPIVELGLLPARNEAGPPFEHSFEPSIAARGDDLVVAYIQLTDADPTTFVFDGEQDKRVGLAISRDRGDSFAAPFDPETTSGLWSTDPVVRVAEDGTFFFAMLGQNADEVAVARSTDLTSWATVYAFPSLVPTSSLDKEWFALDGATIWLGCFASEPTQAYHHLSFDGSPLATAPPEPPRSGVSGMYMDEMGAHFAHFLSDVETLPEIAIVAWDGTNPPVQEGALLPVGLASCGERDLLFYVSTTSLGRTTDRGQWIVRTVERDGAPAIVLRIRHLPSEEGVDLPISEPGAHAFLPTAIVDEDDRLRVVFYDSSGPRGLLRTTRSVSADWADGFEPSTVIDPDVCPGDRWFPAFGAEPSAGGRRLREYIDVSLSSRRVHVAWTHAPVAPSRVRASYIDY